MLHLNGAGSCSDGTKMALRQHEQQGLKQAGQPHKWVGKVHLLGLNVRCPLLQREQLYWGTCLGGQRQRSCNFFLNTYSLAVANMVRSRGLILLPGG